VRKWKKNVKNEKRALTVLNGNCKTPFTAWADVVQLVRTPACHAGGRGFKSRRSRHYLAVIRKPPFVGAFFMPAFWDAV
tara:strand:+ start:2884 stop:3120 length:237 start_codon:yes stop_codon:yes gene_type:complete